MQEGTTEVTYVIQYSTMINMMHHY